MLESLLALFSGGGLLGGALVRVIPMLMEMWTHKKDSDHEYRMTKLQFDLDQARAKMNMEQATRQSDAEFRLMQARTDGELAKEQESNQTAIAKAELEALSRVVEAGMKPTGYKWVDIANASMRPMAFYWHCILLYSLYKALLVTVAVQAHSTLAELVPVVYTEQDAAIFASIMGYLFVDRALRKKPSHG